MNITLNDKPAYKIKAEFVTETKRAYYLDCEGDRKWLAKRFVRFNPTKETLLIESWYYNQEFEND